MDRGQEMLTSAAYQALAPSGRRVLAVVEGEIGDGHAEVTFATLATRLGMGRNSAHYHVRQIGMLGFVHVKRGCNGRNRFQLSDNWKAIDTVEAVRLKRLAMEPTRKPKPVRLRVERRTPSLPVLPWNDGR